VPKRLGENRVRADFRLFFIAVQQPEGGELPCRVPGPNVVLDVLVEDDEPGGIALMGTLM